MITGVNFSGQMTTPRAAWRCTAAVLSAALVLAGCASAPNNKTGGHSSSNTPARYQVKSGDTVGKIAQQYGLNWRELSRINNLDANHTIYAGQWLNLRGVAQSSTQSQRTDIPVNTRATTPATQTNVSTNAPVSQSSTPPNLANNSNAPLVGSSGVMRFRYPVSTSNQVARQFGVSVNGVTSEGMFFAGKEGDSEVATQAGTVVYADKNVPAGERSVVMVQHTDGYTSSYFDIKNIQVSTGQSVRAGDRIGVMQGSNAGVALFEFRMSKNGRYIDPVSVLR